MSELLSIKQASDWASEFLNKNVTPSNISYLIQYGRVKKYGKNGSVSVSKKDLKEYYQSFTHSRENVWKEKLGQDLNWKLSFSEYKEAETTKHVHRLHPYKGKFIPQLVEYFLDTNTDEFKKEVFFQPGNIVLDPFCGSGTTLVQANELGLHAIGIDISEFNSFISNMKINSYDLSSLKIHSNEITKNLNKFQESKNNIKFEKELLDELKKFNEKYFPSPEYKYKIRQGIIKEQKYSKDKEKKFLTVYQALLRKYKIAIHHKEQNSFLDKWFLQVVREEIDFVFSQVKKIKDLPTRQMLGLVLSRTIRSCRATTHADLATLKEPITKTYYCGKHGKICKPLFSILSWWQRYFEDTIKRLATFDKLRTPTNQVCLTGDSRTLNLEKSLTKINHQLFVEVKNKIDGIFSSPPYVGLIDYHEQHAYAYDLFGFTRKDELEIGPLYKGQGIQARESYVEGIAQVLINSKKYLKQDYNVFLVANDKYNLYPRIAEKAGMKIINKYKRPVLNRTEKDKTAYAEIIFHLKEK